MISSKELQLEDVLFPIIQAPVFAKINDKIFKIHGKKALINSNNNYPISVVSNCYKIITNKEAYNYGVECMKILFKMNNEKNIKIYNIKTPETMSFCHIDLITEDNHFSFQGYDKYFPFIRITNSYNTMYKLSFRVGFCRGICENGIIFGDESIKFSFSHLKNYERGIDFSIKEKEFETILNKFKSNIQILTEHSLPGNYSFELFCKAMNIKIDLSIENKEKRKKEIEKLKFIKQYYFSKLSEYIKQVGDNFYALYNVITDYSSNGIDENGTLAMRINGRQMKAGLWLKEISELLVSENLEYENYLKEYLEMMKN